MISSGTAGSTAGECKSYEDRFVRIVTLPSLQKIASSQVALSVWYSYVSRIRDSDDFKSLSPYHPRTVALALGDDYQDGCYPMIESLNTPRSIEISLKRSFDEILDEIRKWVSQLNYLFGISLLCLSQQCIRSFDPNYFHWLPDGTIDYKKTAAKMVRGNCGLTAVQKFVFMSKYCLENEMKKFSLQWLPRDYISSANFIGEYLIYYWGCYLKDELHKIPLAGFDCVDAAMAAKCDSTSWAAFEYFWDRLGVSDQISVAKIWLSHSRPHTGSTQDRLLSKMSWYQQRVLLSEIPEEIIFNFFVTLNSPQSAFWAWTHAKDVMSVEQFADLVANLKVSEQTERFFLLVWDTIPDHLRDHVMQCVERRLSVLFAVINPSATDFALLCKYAPMKKAEFWRTMILNNASHLANYADDPRAMIDFVELCLTDADDLFEFKKSLARSNMMMYSCLRLLGSGNLEYVDMKLKFCCFDAKAVREYKKDVFMQTRVFEKGVFFTDLAKWTQLSEFIDDVYADDAAAASNKKKQFISLYAGAWPNKNDRVDDARFDNMIKVVEMVFAGEELRAIKKVFLRSFLKLRTNRNMSWRDKFTDGKFFLKFVVNWCLTGDEKAISEFKSSLPVDVIFNEIFSKLEREYVRCCWFDSASLVNLDCFLNWYLASDERVKQYKLARIAMSDGLKIFDSVSIHNDKSNLTLLLKWAFGGDEGLARRTIRPGNLKFAMKRLGVFQ